MFVIRCPAEMPKQLTPEELLDLYPMPPMPGCAHESLDQHGRCYRCKYRPTARYEG